MRSEEQPEKDERRTERWLKIASLVFGVWAAMVPIGALTVSRSVEKIIEQQDKFQIEFRTYVLAMERRVTIIEERQAGVLKKLDSIQDDHGTLMQNGRSR